MNIKKNSFTLAILFLTHLNSFAMEVKGHWDDLPRDMKREILSHVDEFTCVGERATRMQAPVLDSTGTQIMYLSVPWLISTSPVNGERYEDGVVERFVASGYRYSENPECRVWDGSRKAIAHKGFDDTSNKSLLFKKDADHSSSYFGFHNTIRCLALSPSEGKVAVCDEEGHLLVADADGRKVEEVDTISFGPADV